MRKPRSRRDDILFISAVSAVLIGLGLLFKTTGFAQSTIHYWPFVVLATGGALLYLSIVRRIAGPIFFGGVLFCLIGCLTLAASLFGWTMGQAWPLFLVAGGFSWLIAGLQRFRRLKAGFAVPSLGFVLMGLFFCLFSFHLLGMTFRHFFALWWPIFFIAGGIALFAIYGANRLRSGRSSRPDEP